MDEKEPSGPKRAAASRAIVPTSHREYTISVVTEELRPAEWKAAATVTHDTDQAAQVIPVPLPDRSFSDRDAAHAFAVEAARAWLDENRPRA